MLWFFDFRMDFNSGMQFYDIQFNGDRIVYEFSFQEVVVIYVGYYLFLFWNNFIDGVWKMGQSSYEMVFGVDVLEIVFCFDLVYMIGMGKLKIF